MKHVPKLLDLCYGRSGDKGDAVNVGLIARDPAHFDFLRQTVTAERVKAHFGPRVDGEVERFELPNLSALNFLLHGASAAAAPSRSSSTPRARPTPPTSSAWRSTPRPARETASGVRGPPPRGALRVRRSARGLWRRRLWRRPPSRWTPRFAAVLADLHLADARAETTGEPADSLRAGRPRRQRPRLCPPSPGASATPRASPRTPRRSTGPSWRPSRMIAPPTP